MTKVRFAAFFLLISGSFLFIGIGKASAATYYISSLGSNTAPYATPAKGATSWAQFFGEITPAAGDIIDGNNEIFYERIVVPSSGSNNNPITYRNFTLDGTLSLDGSWSFNPAKTYSNISPWSLVSGTTELYRKTSTRTPYQFFEDGIKLTPVVSTSEFDAIANVTRGGFSYINATSTLYYRSSDGSDPSNHHIRVTRRDLDGNPGLIYVNNQDHISFSGLTIQNWSPNTVPSAAFLIEGGNNVTLTDSIIKNNSTAADISNSTNVTFTSSVQIIDNIGSGIVLEGDDSDIDLSGTYSNNGRYKNYNGIAYSYGGDGDNIGIGGIGGTMSNITIHNATLTNSGAPDDDTAALAGSGIYVGTSYPMSVSNLKILDNYISGSHGLGTNISQTTSFVVQGNVYANNGHRVGSLYLHNLLASSITPGFTSGKIINNTFVNNPCYGAAAVYINNTNSGMELENNIFYNNGNASTYYGDLWISSTANNVVEKNNIWYRNSTDHDASIMIKRSTALWNRNHIIGTLFGYWQHDSSQGISDQYIDPLFTSASDFSLQPASPAINAGVDVGLTSDYASNPIVGAPDIGAYEYQGAAVDTTPPAAPTGLAVQ